MTVTSRRLAYGVRIHVTDSVAVDNAFSVEPGGSREVALRPIGDGPDRQDGFLTALNLDGSVPIRWDGAP